MALAFAPVTARAQSKTGTTTGQFRLIEPSARIAGMGNAGVGVFEGIQSVYYNPASIGRLDKWSVQVSHSEWLADIDYNYVALSIPAKGIGTFFAGMTSLGSGDIAVRTVSQPLGTGERFSVSNLALSAGYGRQLTERFAAGLQVNYVEETIWHSSLQTFTFNVGTVYTISEVGLELGSSLSNFGTGGEYDGRDLRIEFDQDPTRYGDNSSLPAEHFTDEFPVPVIFRVGVAWPRQIDDDNRLLLAADAFHPNDNSGAINLGAEYMWKETLGFRAGYQDLGQEDSEVGLTLGTGVQGDLDKYEFGFDYAWADHGRLDDTHRMSFVVTF
jgi:hypothetical protein